MGRKTSYHAQIRDALEAGFNKVLGADGMWHDLEWMCNNIRDQHVDVPEHLADVWPGRIRVMVLGDRLMLVRRNRKERK